MTRDKSGNNSKGKDKGKDKVKDKKKKKQTPVCWASNNTRVPLLVGKAESVLLNQLQIIFDEKNMSTDEGAELHKFKKSIPASISFEQLQKIKQPVRPK